MVARMELEGFCVWAFRGGSKPRQTTPGPWERPLNGIAESLSLAWVVDLRFQLGELAGGWPPTPMVHPTRQSAVCTYAWLQGPNEVQPKLLIYSRLAT